MQTSSLALRVASRHFLVFVLFVLTMGFATACAGTQAVRYVCTPCGLPCDSKYFDKPGTCPACGMPLVTEEEAKAAAAKVGPGKKVAILIFDGVQIIDFTGPYEMFSAANFQVYTVGKTREPITTAGGMTVIPKYTFDDAPPPDVLVVPGGGVRGAQDDARTLKWITDETDRVQHTMSVCNGAFILASAGLLDGLSATTTNGNIPRLKNQFPKINVVNDQRYVDNGKIITTAGLSAGIDGALHVVERLMGQGYAEQVALIEEYEWKPRATFVRAALADRQMPNVDLGADYETWELISTEGGTDHWERVFRGTSKKGTKELLDYFGVVYSTAGKWRNQGAGADGTSTWKFEGDNGTVWSGTVTVQATSEQSHQYTVTVRIARGA